MPKGIPTDAHRRYEPTGGTTDNSSIFSSFSTSEISSRYIIEKNEDNSGEYHTLNNP
jgi:hypothetical protein